MKIRIAVLGVCLAFCMMFSGALAYADDFVWVDIPGSVTFQDDNGKMVTRTFGSFASKKLNRIWNPHKPRYMIAGYISVKSANSHVVLHVSEISHIKLQGVEKPVVITTREGKTFVATTFNTMIRELAGMEEFIFTSYNENVQMGTEYSVLSKNVYALEFYED